MGGEKKVLGVICHHIEWEIFIQIYWGRERMGKELVHSAAFGWEPVSTRISSNIFWEITK